MTLISTCGKDNDLLHNIIHILREIYIYLICIITIILFVSLNCISNDKKKENYVHNKFYNNIQD